MNIKFMKNEKLISFRSALKAEDFKKLGALNPDIFVLKTAEGKEKFRVAFDQTDAQISKYGVCFNTEFEEGVLVVIGTEKDTKEAILEDLFPIIMNVQAIEAQVAAYKAEVAQDIENLSNIISE